MKDIDVGRHITAYTVIFRFAYSLFDFLYAGFDFVCICSGASLGLFNNRRLLKELLRCLNLYVKWVYLWNCTLHSLSFLCNRCSFPCRNICSIRICSISICRCWLRYRWCYVLIWQKLSHRLRCKSCKLLLLHLRELGIAVNMYLSHFIGYLIWLCSLVNDFGISRYSTDFSVTSSLCLFLSLILPVLLILLTVFPGRSIYLLSPCLHATHSRFAGNKHKGHDKDDNVNYVRSDKSKSRHYKISNKSSHQTSSNLGLSAVSKGCGRCYNLLAIHYQI